MRNTSALALALAALAFAGNAQAAELVTNGTFETGDLTGWTQFGNTGFSGVTTSPYANSGDYGAFFGPVGSLGGIEQVLNTVAGTDYTISFFLRNFGGTPNAFKAFFDGVELQQFTNNNGLPFIQFSYSGTALTDSSVLRFEFRQDPSFWALDDVSVQGLAGAVPETSTWAMMILGLGAVGAAMRRRQRQTVNYNFA